MLSKLPFYQMVRNAGGRLATACQNWIHAQIRIMFVITLECAAGYWLLLHLPGAGLWAVLDVYKRQAPQQSYPSPMLPEAVPDGEIPVILPALSESALR